MSEKWEKMRGKLGLNQLQREHDLRQRPDERCSVGNYEATVVGHTPGCGSHAATSGDSVGEQGVRGYGPLIARIFG